MRIKFSVNQKKTFIDPIVAKFTVTHQYKRTTATFDNLAGFAQHMGKRGETQLALCVFRLHKLEEISLSRDDKTNMTGHKISVERSGSL